MAMVEDAERDVQEGRCARDRSVACVGGVLLVLVMGCSRWK
jgi:hypothetical protein